MVTALEKYEFIHVINCFQNTHQSFQKHYVQWMFICSSYTSMLCKWFECVGWQPLGVLTQIACQSVTTNTVQSVHFQFLMKYVVLLYLFYSYNYTTYWFIDFVSFHTVVLVCCLIVWQLMKVHGPKRPDLLFLILIKLREAQ